MGGEAEIDGPVRARAGPHEMKRLGLVMLKDKACSGEECMDERVRMIQHTTVHLDGVGLGGNSAVVDKCDKGGAQAHSLIRYSFMIGAMTRAERTGERALP